MNEGNKIGGASPAPKPVPKSRSKAYRRAYHRACYATISACIPRPEKEAFQEACRRHGRTQHAIIAELVANWMAENQAFNYNGHPVIFVD